MLGFVAQKGSLRLPPLKVSDPVVWTFEFEGYVEFPPGFVDICDLFKRETVISIFVICRLSTFVFKRLCESH